MEALVAAATAALTIYDMCKALDKGIEISELFLLEKTGGKSGDFHRKSHRQDRNKRREATARKSFMTSFRAKSVRLLIAEDNP